MKNSFNIYCDESCHLENDHIKSMSRLTMGGNSKRTLTNQTVRSLSVRLSCVQAWKAKLTELQTLIEATKCLDWL